MTAPILACVTREDEPFLTFLKPILQGAGVVFSVGKIEFLTILAALCKKRGITQVITTDPKILAKLVDRENFSPNKIIPKINDYAGSLFDYEGIEILILDPLSHLVKVPHGKFLAQRFVSKLINPAKWRESLPFQWAVFTPENAEQLFARAASAKLLATDIETTRKNLAIQCVGYTAVDWSPDGTATCFSFVVPLDSVWALAWIRKLNTLAAAKVFQNGKYDNLYFLRFNCAPTNWIWDTAHFMHSWFAELPKDLGFLNAFFLRKVVYWKDLSESGDKEDFFRYCALDSWATANVLLSQISEAPAWAKRNYFLEFPLVFPSLLAEGTGLLRDSDRHKKVRTEVETKANEAVSFLRRVLRAPGFNPNSYQQVRKLLKLLTGKDHEESDEVYLKKIAFAHPLNALLIDKILDYRGLIKLKGTYLRTDEDADKKGEGGSKDYKGTILYSLNPHGTETGRNASKESALWCGFNIQNIPRGWEVKHTIVAEPGFFFAEADLEQAESRDTAFISGDPTLIEAVSSGKDFHSFNASQFFGVPYDSIYDDATGKTLNKPLRQLAKPINHGANYNMGPGVMADTIGLAGVWDIKTRLNLPFTSPLEVTEAALTTFHLTYKTLRGIIQFKSPKVAAYFGLAGRPYKLFAPGSWYQKIAMEVSMTGMLVSRAYHHTPFNLRKWPSAEAYIEEGDWTRKCFGDPENKKPDLNAYAAHPPQSLNARTLNEAFMQVFYEVALPRAADFRLHAQIHDSIFFSYRQGCGELGELVKQLMEIPVTVRDVSGIVRIFTVPAALKNGKLDKATGQFKPAKYWDETE
jgi:DNA polymerase I-like protein with 3'-5' exonuclease and polymerase domains